MQSDLLVSNGTHILTRDISANGGGDLTATNITVWGGSFGAQLFDSALVLDSSIFGDAGISPNGTASCTITNSRGPVIAASPSGCSAFQTTASPQFANPDGDQRAIAGVCGGTPRRDIGADEFRPTCSIGGPATAIAPNPLCATLRTKLKKAKNRGQKAKVRKLRRKLRRLGP